MGWLAYEKCYEQKYLKDNIPSKLGTWILNDLTKTVPIIINYLHIERARTYRKRFRFMLIIASSINSECVSYWHLNLI